MSKLEIKRNIDWINFTQDCSIYIDDLMVGTLSSGRTLDYEVSNGKHRIKAVINKIASNELEVNIIHKDKNSIKLVQSKSNYMYILFVLLLAPLKIYFIQNVVLWLIIIIVLSLAYYILYGRKNSLKLKLIEQN